MRKTLGLALAMTLGLSLHEMLELENMYRRHRSNRHQRRSASVEAPGPRRSGR